MQKGFHRFSALLVLVISSACSTKIDAPSEEVVKKIDQGLACENFRSQIFDAFYDYLETQQASPDEDTLIQALRVQKNKAVVAAAQRASFDRMYQELEKLVHLMTQETVQDFKATQWQSHIQHLIEMEMSDTSSGLNIQKNSKLKESLAKIKSLSKELDLACEQPEENPPNPAPPNAGTPTPSPFDPTPAPSEPAPTEPGRRPAALQGNYFAFSTAYQSCQVLDLPPLDANTPDLKGVAKENQNGAGWGRRYTSISQLQNTHYYVRNQSYGTGCFSVKDSPLVYDYGGQPKIENSQKRINFFVNSGTGGSALGIDCSALISSGLAAAGLRYTPELPNKPVYIRQTSAKFIDPAKSGWKCFDRIQVTPLNSIQPGDIMAVDGHVVMIDQVTNDPFGVQKVTRREDCSKISRQNYEFVILQSSPSKNSIGINRYLAKDYLLESPGGKMEKGFYEYAYKSCLAKFDNKTYAVTSSAVGIIRHKETAECLDQPVELSHQSCIASCF